MKVKAGEIEALPKTATDLAREKFSQTVPSLLKLGSLFLPSLLLAQSATAAENKATTSSPTTTTTSAPEPLGPPPTNFGLKHEEYYTDCQQLVDHMRYAVQLEKGNPIIVEVAEKTKEEMIDFVSYYRRFTGIAGRQTFSLLYTSVNVLAGHYTSYGPKVPVPEKRKKRLLQELKDIEKAIKRKR